jgi:hypothetical protein
MVYGNIADLPYKHLSAALEGEKYRFIYGRTSVHL